MILMGGSALAAPSLVQGSAKEMVDSLLAGFDPSPDPWDEVPKILDRIKAPVFPNKAFDVTKFGAVADNETDCTEAIQKAVAACNRAGGGRVVVPKGEFLTGAIHLKSNVNLHL